MSGKGCILLIDDEAPIRQMLKIFFEKKGYSVLEAPNGEEGVKALSEREVSIVLLDIEMPGMGGLATLEKIHEMKPALSVVMATGNQKDERVTKALALGAVGYVLKPFDFLYLELVVASHLKAPGK